MVGSEGYTYLDMPSSLYEGLFKDYPGDFRLVNKQYLIDLASQDKPIILETPYLDLTLNYRKSSAYWEVQTLMDSDKFGYTLQEEPGPNGYDMLIPPAK